MTGCDVNGCTAPIRFRLYAAYNADHGENIHPLHARYPAAMHRSCSEHIGTLALGDAASPFSTRQWLVVAIGESA
jgi:hypothetical protein